MWLVCGGDQPRLICPPAPLPIVITTTTKGSEGGVRKMVTGVLEAFQTGFGGENEYGL